MADIINIIIESEDDEQLHVKYAIWQAARTKMWHEIFLWQHEMF